MSPLCKSISPLLMPSCQHNCNKPCGWFKLHDSIILHGFASIMWWSFRVLTVILSGIWIIIQYEILSSLIFGQVHTDGQTDRKWPIWAQNAQVGEKKEEVNNSCNFSRSKCSYAWTISVLKIRVQMNTRMILYTTWKIQNNSTQKENMSMYIFSWRDVTHSEFRTHDLEASFLKGHTLI